MSSVIHQNIQSLRANFDIFNAYLSSLKVQPLLIFVSEIWIYSHESSYYRLPNYNFIACCNDDYRSGGVGVFINQNLTVSSFHCYNWTTADVLILNVTLGRHDWTFICIYRFCNKPVNSFCVDIEELLLSINNNNIVILGDININLLNINECYSYLTMLASHGFLSLLNEATRHSSCLDHVFIKSTNSFIFTVENTPIHLSDHNLIKLNIFASQIPVLQNSVAANFSRVDYSRLNARLQSESWATVYCENNCNIAFDRFLFILKSHIRESKVESSAPTLKKLKPWMNSYLLLKVHKLKKFSRKLRHNPTNARLEKFVKKLSKEVNARIKFVKNSFYKKKFEYVKNSSKLTWKAIDEVLGTNKDKNRITKIYKYQSDVLISNYQSISNEFNTYFLNVPSEITNNLNNTNFSPNSPGYSRYVLGSTTSPSMSCVFDSISAREIIKEISSLKNKHSCGIDGIDNLILKNCVWNLVDVLAYLFNFSLESGVFPDVFKSALVIPIHKKGDVLLLNNYRPISLLSSFSKLFEKIIKRRLLGYLEKINFFSRSQFGFLAGRSSEEALLHHLSYVYSAFNNSQKSASLFLDIAKAFDTVDHEVLANKLLNIGIRGKVFDWFVSYFNNRSQIVKINDKFSEPGYLNCGVPQGSVLGPILFLIYINSIFDIDLLGHTTAFADDLALSYTSANPSELQNLVCTDLVNLGNWFYYHRLALSNKSRVMFFGQAASPNFKVLYHVPFCSGHSCSSQCFEISLVNEFKYLGVTIDSQLKWNSHLTIVRKNVITAAYKFYHLKQLCPPSTLRVLYHALVESIIMYGISSWGGIYFSNIEDLYISQKRIIKLIYCRPLTTPTIPLFRDLKLLPLRYLYVYKVLKMFFVRSSSFHSRIHHTYTLRNPNNFAGLRCNNERFRRSYFYMGLYWFHKLPIELKFIPIGRKHYFDKMIRHWLINIDNIETYF